MEKPREIPATFPNAAPRAAIEDAVKRVAALGVKWSDAVERSGLSRNLGYTLKRGTGSVGSLRKVEEWLAREEAATRTKRPAAKSGTTEEWSALGTELYELDPTEFEHLLEGLREIVTAERQKRGAILKMFRATPDRLR